jgi:hypothetical protein
MTDLNTAIALQRGWKQIFFDAKNVSGLSRWINEFGQIYSEPDFEHVAHLYMALFEEMSSEFFLLTLMQHDYDNKTIITGDYRQGHNENIPQFVVESQPIGTAICLAYVKLKGIEVVG